MPDYVYSMVITLKKVKKLIPKYSRIINGKKMYFNKYEMWVHCRTCGVPLNVMEKVECARCDPEQKVHRNFEPLRGSIFAHGDN